MNASDTFNSPLVEDVSLDIDDNIDDSSKDLKDENISEPPNLASVDSLSQVQTINPNVETTSIVNNIEVFVSEIVSTNTESSRVTSLDNSDIDTTTTIITEDGKHKEVFEATTSNVRNDSDSGDAHSNDINTDFEFDDTFEDFMYDATIGFTPN